MLYSLLDCKKMNIENPTTFEVPSVDEIDQIKIGDSVKLIFIYPEPIQSPFGLTDSERLWVNVISIEQDSFQGLLDNSPLHPALQTNMVVNFASNHIASIY